MESELIESKRLSWQELMASPNGTMDIPPVKLVKPIPTRIVTNEDVSAIIREALAHATSDIHINIGHPITLEIYGKWHRLTGRRLDASEFDIIANVIRDKDDAISMLRNSSDWDGAYSLYDYGDRRRRLRVNMTPTTMTGTNSSAGIVMRPLDDIPPLPQELGMSDELIDLCYPTRRAVYVVGPTGSGKTTTFASLIRWAALSGYYYHGHLATYESPVEYDLASLSSIHLLITQVAIHENWGLKDFASGVRNALRRHPALIMVGEARDYETVHAVIEAALTGHPVFATVHADNSALAFQRLATRFPESLQSGAINDLIMTTDLILSQRLIPSADGKRVALREWISFNNEVREKLLQTGSSTIQLVHTMNSLIDTNGRSFLTSAQELFSQGQITRETLRMIERESR